MIKPPVVLDGCRVEQFVLRDRSMKFRGQGRLFRGEKEVGPVPRLALARHRNNEVLLLHCNSRWQVLGVSGGHATVREAKRDAERFYTGISKGRHITSAHISDYQNARTDAGRASRTINGELSVLRQVMKHARVWYRCEPDYRVLRNRRPPAGQALTPEEQDTLFATARTKGAWLYAYVASTLAFYCGMRACEIKALHWGDIDFGRQLLHVRRSKTPAGWRSPTLNPTSLQVLQELHERAEKIGFTQPAHFVFPGTAATSRSIRRGR